MNYLKFFFFSLLSIPILLSAQKLIVQSGHYKKVNQTQFTKDGKTLVTAGDDGKIVFWDVNSRLQKASVKAFDNEISCFAYNEVSNKLIVGNWWGYLKVYNLDSSNTKPYIYEKFLYKVTSAQFSPNGENMAYSSADNSLKLLRGDRSEEIYLSDDLLGVTFSKDNKFLYFGSRNKNIYQFDLKKNLLLKI